MTIETFGSGRPASSVTRPVKVNGLASKTIVRSRRCPPPGPGKRSSSTGAAEPVSELGGELDVVVHDPESSAQPLSSSSTHEYPWSSSQYPSADGVAEDGVVEGRGPEPGRGLEERSGVLENESEAAGSVPVLVHHAQRERVARRQRDLERFARAVRFQRVPHDPPAASAEAYVRRLEREPLEDAAAVLVRRRAGRAGARVGAGDRPARFVANDEVRASVRARGAGCRRRRRPARRPRRRLNDRGGPPLRIDVEACSHDRRALVALPEGRGRRAVHQPDREAAVRAAAKPVSGDGAPLLKVA